MWWCLFFLVRVEIRIQIQGIFVYCFCGLVRAITLKIDVIGRIIFKFVNGYYWAFGEEKNKCSG